jgi:hypothetical protein
MDSLLDVAAKVLRHRPVVLLDNLAEAIQHQRIYTNVQGSHPAVLLCLALWHCFA